MMHGLTPSIHHTCSVLRFSRFLAIVSDMYQQPIGPTLTQREVGRMRIVEIPPKPSSLVESMRDIGYSLGTALADIVDNSITAGARRIKLFATLDGPDSKIAILDDGVGMSEGELLEAMRMGSRSPLEERGRSDLGRFGLGLKTASFSQCRVLTVVTRTNGATACARWDLDEISSADRWQVQVLDDTTSIPWVQHLGQSGTLVVWERLGLGAGDGGHRQYTEDMTLQLDEARSHLELVFHRFLETEPGRPHIEIELNNRPLKAFDPFHSRHPATIIGEVENIQVGNHHVVLRPFTLPHHSRVSAQEWEYYAGREGYIRNQGFYVYRERRLIIHGTWFGLARQTELTKLTRVRVDMPNALDGPWRIDVKKASAQLPPSVRERLRRIIEPLASDSKRVYTTRGRRLIDDNQIPVWSRVQNKGQISYRINDEHPMIRNLAASLPDEGRADFRRVIEIAGSSLPMDALFADLGGSAHSVVNGTTSQESLRYAALSTYAHLLSAVTSNQNVLDIMRVAEPFRSNWDQTLQILKEATDKGLTDD